MQQTENYKLNLIETDDPFSPAALNENAQTVDAALTDVTGRVTMLEAKKIVVGNYASGAVQTIDLGFTPIMVWIADRDVNAYDNTIVLRDFCSMNRSNIAASIVPNGFRITSSGIMNRADHTYNYIAFG